MFIRKLNQRKKMILVTGFCDTQNTASLLVQLSSSISCTFLVFSKCCYPPVTLHKSSILAATRVLLLVSGSRSLPCSAGIPLGHSAFFSVLTYSAIWSDEVRSSTDSTIFRFIVSPKVVFTICLRMTIMRRL